MSKNKNLWLLMAGSLMVSIVTVTLAFMPSARLSAASSFANVQVNQVLPGPFPKNKQNEPSLAQNPTNLQNLIAGSNDEIGLPACTDTTPSSCPFTAGVSVSGFYASFDGGLTWPCQGLIDLSAFGEYAFGDPSQVFDSRGNAYYGTLAFPFPPTATADQLATGLNADFFVAKSTDGGCTYNSAALVSGASPAIFDDKDAITADANATSPFRDSVYAAWTKFTRGGDQIVFSRSTDGGGTWSNPLPISPSYNNNVVGGRQGATVKVGSDGTVYVVWLDTVDKQTVQRLSISHDGGKTFPKQNITVATVTDDFVSPAPGSSFRQDARAFPSFTISPDGTLYVAWSNRTDGLTTGHALVLLTKSTTGGLTWTTPVVAGNVTLRSAFFASVAAEGAKNVNVVFLAMDDVPTGTAPGPGVVQYDAYLTRSTDGGATFSPPLMISTATSDPDGSSTNSLRAQFLGDYITAVADGSHVYAVWTDSRNATSCEAVDTFRVTQKLADKPDVITQCPTTFGNTDIVLGIITP